MGDPENIEIEKKRLRFRTVLTWVLSPIFLSVATWILIKQSPTAAVCYFRDVWFLRILWPPNEAMFHQVQTMNYPENKLCVLFAACSIHSLCFAVMFAVVNYFVSWKNVPPKPVGPKVWIFDGLILAALFAILSGGFNDKGRSGHHTSYSLRSYNSVDVLFGKSVWNMFIAYMILFYLIWIIRSYLYRKDVK